MAHAAADDGTPESATLSIVDEAEDFPSIPHDLDFYSHEPTAFELSQILDSLDCDRNLRDSVEPKHERKLQSSAMKKPEGTYEANVVGRDIKNQQMKKKEADVRPVRHSSPALDERIRQPKQMKLKALNPEAKFENGKRRLQESHKQHEKD
ncbi:hypothetical protein YC2023_018076 [Brassica napus]